MKPTLSAEYVMIYFSTAGGSKSQRNQWLVDRRVVSSQCLTEVHS